MTKQFLEYPARLSEIDGMHCIEVVDFPKLELKAPSWEQVRKIAAVNLDAEVQRLRKNGQRLPKPSRRLPGQFVVYVKHEPTPRRKRL